MILSKKTAKKIQKNFWEKMENLFRMEKKCTKKSFQAISLSQKSNFSQQKEVLFKRNTKDMILEGGWLLKWILIITQDLKIIF